MTPLCTFFLQIKFYYRVAHGKSFKAGLTENQFSIALTSFCILKIKSIKDKKTNKFETIISGAEVGSKIFTGEILEGRLVDDNLSVKVSTNIHEEIVIEGRFTVYVKMKNTIIPVDDVISLIEYLPIQGL